MDKILLGHGSGGKMMHELVSKHFAPAFGIEGVADAAVLDTPKGGRIAMSTDSYVVSPLFFPGGNIGDLAVHGTVNDLAMVGARPLYLTAGFIIEEGFSFDELKRIVSTMAQAATNAGVKVVAGDTKVVDKGKGDGIFINTAGVGVIDDDIELGIGRVAPGDKIIVSGNIGRHGVAVMAKRNGLTFEPPVLSDSAALNHMVAQMLKDNPQGVKVLRDPTRGGVATTLKEFALESGLCMNIYEDQVPVQEGVRGACDLLGLDPLYVANEGTLLAVVGSDVSDYYLNIVRGMPHGADAMIIGEVSEAPKGAVLVRTAIGGSRIVDMLQGEQLPRIC
jgi:hydrogenase expression/formation protein HypE